MRKLLQLIWINAGVYSTLLSWTALCVIFSPFLFIIFTKALQKDPGKTLREFIWYYGWGCTKLLSLFVDLKWPQQADLPKPCIIVANHESFFDPYLVSFQPERNICLTVRNWPFKIPFYGFYMHQAGYINVETDDLAKIKTQAFDILKKNASLLFFPEGTRSKDGKMNRFHSGPFHIAMESGIPVVPMCFTGTFELLRRGSFIIRPSVVRAEILDPIYPYEYKNKQNPHIELRKEVKKTMVSCTRRLKRQDSRY